jgi:hypothetical protein
VLSSAIRVARAGARFRATPRAIMRGGAIGGYAPRPRAVTRGGAIGGYAPRPRAVTRGVTILVQPSNARTIMQGPPRQHRRVALGQRLPHCRHRRLNRGAARSDTNGILLSNINHHIRNGILQEIATGRLSTRLRRMVSSIACACLAWSRPWRERPSPRAHKSRLRSSLSADNNETGQPKRTDRLPIPQ